MRVPTPLSPQNRAVLLLIAATVGWALSFPLQKAILFAEELAVPGRSSWFYSGICLSVRFGLAALAMAILRPGHATWQITRSEWSQGLGLGVFGGFGILLQVDGLHHTDASTSAFLTQFYCALLPFAAAIRDRKKPQSNVLLACGLVLAGVAILAHVDLRKFTIGRGELETLGAATLFTGQILWLERKAYEENSTWRMTLVMFASTAALLLIMTIPHMRLPSDLAAPLATLPLSALTGAVVIVCTLGSYGLMNWQQRHIDATRAGIVYCSEPVFATLFAAFMPAWLSLFAGVSYANEAPGWSLLLGGGLIVAANLVITLSAAKQPPANAHPPA